MTTTMTPRFPEVELAVDLSGPDGNAFVLLAKVNQLLKAAGATTEELTTFRKAATAGDYRHLLRTCAEWLDFQPLNGNLLEDL